MVDLDRVPLCHFVPNCQFAVSLDNYLANEAENLTVKQQLISRHVSFVGRTKMRWPYHAGIIHWNGTYAVQLRDSDSLSGWIQSIGHELAHTFEDPTNLNGFLGLTPADVPNYQIFEKLCEQFAARWAALPIVKASKWEILAEIAINKKIHLALPHLTT